MNERNPESPTELQRLKSAIRAAADRDDAAEMVAACLGHARLTAQMRPRDPLEALSRLGVAEALRSANDYRPEWRILWQLLMARQSLERTTDDSRPDTNTILQHLQNQIIDLAPMQHHGNDAAAWLIELLLPDAPDTITVIAGGLLSDTSLYRLSERLAAQNRFTDADTIALQIRDNSVRSQALSALAHSQSIAGQREDATRTLQRAMDLARYSSASSEKAAAFIASARAATSLSLADSVHVSLQAARQATEQISSREEKADSYALLAVAQSQAGFPDDSQMSFEAALSLIHTERNLQEQDAALLSRIATCQFTVAQTAAAMQSIELAWTPAIRSLYSKEYHGAFVIKALASAGLVADAKRRFDALFQNDREFYLKLDALLSIVEAAIRTSDIQADELLAAALTLARSPIESYQRANGLCAIANSLRRTHRRVDAKKYTEEALRSTRAIEPTILRPRYFISLADQQAQLGLTSEAAMTLAEALHCTDASAEDWSRTRMLANLVSLQADEGVETQEIERQLPTTWKQQPHLQFPQIQRMTLQARMMAGEKQSAAFSRATALARKLDEEVWGALSFLTIANAQADSGLIDEARLSLQNAESAAVGEEDMGERAKNDFRYALTFARLGLQEDARNHLNYSVQSSSEMFDDDWELNSLQSQIAIAQCRLGFQEDREATTRLLEEDGFQAFTMQRIEQIASGFDELPGGFSGRFLEAVDRIPDPWWKAETIAVEAIDRAQRGDFENAIALCDAIQANHSTHLPHIARAIAERESTIAVPAGAPRFAHFKKMLLHCADSLPCSMGICSILIDIYPQQGREIAQAIRTY